MTPNLPPDAQARLNADGNADPRSSASKPTGRRRFRFPSPILSLIMFICLAVLLTLGTWQARRFSEATDMVAYYKNQHDTLPALAKLGPLDGDARKKEVLFRRVELDGKLDLDHIELLTARYKLGQLGYGVLVPLKTGEKTGDVLTYLGWVPKDRLAEYLKTLRSSPTTRIEGRLQYVEPELNPEHQQKASEVDGLRTWMRPAPAALKKHNERLNPDWIILTGNHPTGEQVDLEKIPQNGYKPLPRLAPSKHIEYSATWYGVALAVIAVFIALCFRPEDEVVLEEDPKPTSSAS